MGNMIFMAYVLETQIFDSQRNEKLADPMKLFFFAAKLGHFTICDFFLYVTKHSN